MAKLPADELATRILAVPTALAMLWVIGEVIYHFWK
jgi:hypothetical protein